MTPRALAAKIEELPPDARAEVEDFVECIVARTRRTLTSAGTDGDMVGRLRARRERLLREHGLFDTLPILRELRGRGR